MIEDAEKDLKALGLISQARAEFNRRICEISASQAPDVLDKFRQEKIWEFAEFYFSISCMGFTDPDDIDILADLHNDRIETLLKDQQALERRSIAAKPLLEAIFTSDTMPRLRLIWRERPGAIDQSNLARFLAPQMSTETTRRLIKACAAAGFLTVSDHPFGAKIVVSTGVLELELQFVLRNMRISIANL